MSENLPAVSIVVAAYQAESTLEECIASLLALDYPQDLLEFLFVDNNSTDGTAAILARHAGRIRIFAERRQGPSAARNRGIAEAKHEIVAFTDSDCVVDPRWLRGLVAPLAEPGVGVSGGRILARVPANPIERFGEKIHDHEHALSRTPPYLITMNWASPLAVLRALGGFDPELRRGEDVDLSYRIFEAGHRFVYAPEAVIWHRNESTLAGLFHEGFVHGFYAVPLLRKHRTLVKRFVRNRHVLRGYQAVARGFLRAAAKGRQDETLYTAVFSAGKNAGKLCGSARFGCLEL